MWCLPGSLLRRYADCVQMKTKSHHERFYSPPLLLIIIGSFISTSGSSARTRASEGGNLYKITFFEFGTGVLRRVDCMQLHIIFQQTWTLQEQYIKEPFFSTFLLHSAKWKITKISYIHKTGR